MGNRIRIVIFLLMVFLSINKLFSAGVYPLIDAKAISLGGCYSVVSGFANPAIYDFLLDDNKVVSLQYLNRFGMKELSTYAGFVNVPNKFLNTGVYVSRYGFKDYNETMASLHVYRKLSHYISLGVRINYFNIHYSAVANNKSVINADVFLTVQPVDNLLLSVLVINPIAVGVQVGNEKVNLPIILSVGAGYRFLNRFNLLVEVEKDFSNALVGKFGFEYNPISQLCFRAGVYGKPFTPCFGIGFRFSSFVFDLSFNRHPTLGFCSACGLSFHY